MQQALAATLQEEFDAAAAAQDCFVATLEMPLLGEVYSDAEPVARVARARGHATIPTMTLKTGYNFLRAPDRARALNEVRRLKQYCLVIAFPCGPWSSLRNWELARGEKKVRLLRERHRALVNFAVELATVQRDAGLHYAIENPQGSAAWREVVSLRKLRETDRTYKVNFHQCALDARCPETGKLIRKATRFLTSSPELCHRFQRHLCSRDHEHAWVMRQTGRTLNGDLSEANGKREGARRGTTVGCGPQVGPF